MTSDASRLQNDQGGALLPGQVLARGVCRCLSSLGFAPLVEFVPARGLRVDVMALGPKGEIWVVECKSSRADFRADQKWQGYLEWCDRFFWAVDPDFPQELLPADSGLILGDRFGAEILRMPDASPLAPARRKAVVQGFARQAALRLARLQDPHDGGMG
ncbi:MAG: MmcB family DNA repair protein [Roseinatronobacter sp.]